MLVLPTIMVNTLGREKDTLVICNICGKEDWTNFETGMSEGWPICCQEEMEMAESIATESKYDRLLKKPKVRIRSKYSEKRYIP